MAGPLTGFRIIDMTSMIAGPLAAMQLADQGADVIKIEGPDRPDHVRRAGYGLKLTASFVNNNRNKRSLVVDVKDSRGREILLRLARTSDVFMQNYRTGVMDRLGLGYDALRAVNGKLVYLSMYGFGATGPYATKPVYDPIIQALSGLATIQAGSDDARPRLVRTIVPDKVTALTAAQAVTAALLARSRTGEGQHVQLSMLDAVVAFLWSSDMGGQTFVGHEVSAQRAATFIDLIYETKNGYISVSVMTDEQWRALCKSLGREEWLEDVRFKTPALRDANADERLNLTQQALMSESAEYWLKVLEAAGVPCAPVLTRQRMIDHGQVAANGIIEEIDHPHAGKLRQARAPARFSKDVTEHQRGAPLFGEHSRAILQELDYRDAEIDQLANAGVIKIDALTA